MTRPPSISVVIPCFNAETYVASAIRSVLKQNWPNLEIVVVDDGSSDHSFQVVRDTFPEVTVLRQANQGVAAARNNGIKYAKGDWIAFLDADDLWLPGKLNAQSELLRASPSVRACYTAWQVWASSDPLPTPDFMSALVSLSGDIARWSGATGWVYPQLLLDCVVWTSTVLLHRSVFSEVGLFDPTLRIGEDYDLWLRVSRITQFLRVPVPFALYRMHPSSLTKSAPEDNYHSVVVGRALARWGYRSPDGGIARKGDVARGLARSWGDFASAHLEREDLDRAMHGGFMALRADWRYVRAWKILIRSVARSLSWGNLPSPVRDRRY